MNRVIEPIRYEAFSADTPTFTSAVKLYAETWGHPLATSMTFFERYSKHPGFVGRVALAGETVVGMGFGSDGQRGNWWYDKVVEACGTSPYVRDAWVLVELCVHPECRRQGIGSMLMQHLFAAVNKRSILLSTQVTNIDAQRLYIRKGLVFIHRGLAFAPGQPLYAVMGKRLHDLSKQGILR